MEDARQEADENPSPRRRRLCLLVRSLQGRDPLEKLK